MVQSSKELGANPRARMPEPPRVAVIGGGPAGSVAATTLAQRGISVVLLERDKFPRFHIGESLLPNGNYLLKKIGVWDKVAAGGFVEKRAGQFTLADRSRTMRNVFANGMIKGLTMAYQVERSRFDDILLRHAAQAGAEVREQTVVTQVARSGDSNGDKWQVTVKSAQQVETLNVDWIIDASGRDSFMGRALKLKKASLPYPGRAAVFTHFENMVRETGERAGDTIILRLEDAWVWVIPLSATLTSVGVVVQKGSTRHRGETWEALFWRKIAESTYMSACLKNATAVEEYRVESDYSFSYENFGTDRVLLAGDAASFIDPIFSSGVYLAIESGHQAANLIADNLAGKFRARKPANIYRAYTRLMKRQIGHMRQLIDAYYDKDSFEVFMSPRPVLQLPGAVNSVLAGSLLPRLTIRWRLWLFKKICALQKRYRLVPRIEWPERTE